MCRLSKWFLGKEKKTTPKCSVMCTACLFCLSCSPLQYVSAAIME